MKTPLLVVCAAALGAGLVSAPAQASSIQEAQDLVDEAEYEQAARVLRTALSEGNLAKTDLVELYRLQGTVMVALGRRGRAEAAFRNLILADPSFSLPRGISPKVRDVFDAVQKELRESGGLDETYRPQLVPVGSVAPGKDVALRLEIGDRARAGQIQAVQFYYRRVGTPHYASVDGQTTPDGAWAGVIPGFFLDAEREDYAVEYYVEASDAGGSRLTGVGMPTLPLIFEVLGTEPELGGGREDPPEDNSVWMTVGIVAGAVVVVGALVGVGLYVLLSQQGTGSATVTVTKAN